MNGSVTVVSSASYVKSNMSSNSNLLLTLLHQIASILEKNALKLLRTPQPCFHERVGVIQVGLAFHLLRQFPNLLALFVCSRNLHFIQRS